MGCGGCTCLSEAGNAESGCRVRERQESEVTTILPSGLGVEAVMEGFLIQDLPARSQCRKALRGAETPK